MILTASQITTWKAHIATNTNTVLIADVPTAINTLDITNGDHAFVISQWYNQTATPDFIVWRDLQMDTVLGLITYSNMTPIDAVPTNNALNTSIWQCRSLACQGKQFNLQNLTIGRTIAPMKQSNYRAAMQDCLTNLPAGVNGAMLSAGWVAVRDAAKFLATRLEQILATGQGTIANPADLTFEGSAQLPI